VWAVAGWVGISWNGEIVGFKTVFETVEGWWSYNGKRGIWFHICEAKEKARWLNLVFILEHLEETGQ